jgi:hypothetical protein
MRVFNGNIRVNLLIVLVRGADTPWLARLFVIVL